MFTRESNRKSSQDKHQKSSSHSYGTVTKNSYLFSLSTGCNELVVPEVENKKCNNDNHKFPSTETGNDVNSKNRNKKREDKMKTKVTKNRENHKRREI